MLGGAVLNASTFIGGSYLAKYLSGSKTDQERRRHDKALEKYQRDYAKYQENRQKLLDWQEQKQTWRCDSFAEFRKYWRGIETVQ